MVNISFSLLCWQCVLFHTHKEQRSAILYAHLGTLMGRSGGRCSLLNIGGFSLCDLWLCSWKAPSDRMCNADNGNRRLILLLLWIQQPDKCLKVQLSKILFLKCSLHLSCSALIRAMSLHFCVWWWLSLLPTQFICLSRFTSLKSFNFTAVNHLHTVSHLQNDICRSQRLSSAPVWRPAVLTVRQLSLFELGLGDFATIWGCSQANSSQLIWQLAPWLSELIS